MGKEPVTYQLVIFDERVWRRDCSHIPKTDLLRIMRKVHVLQAQPMMEGVDVKMLQHYDAADFRLRVGPYRILFNRDDASKTVFLLRVLHRSKLY